MELTISINGQFLISVVLRKIGHKYPELEIESSTRAISTKNNKFKGKISGTTCAVKVRAQYSLVHTYVHSHVGSVFT